MTFQSLERAYFNPLEGPYIQVPQGLLVGQDRVLKGPGETALIGWGVRNDGAGPGTARLLVQLLSANRATVLAEAVSQSPVAVGQVISFTSLPALVPATQPPSFLPVRVELSDITTTPVLVASRELLVSVNGPVLVTGVAFVASLSSVLLSITLSSFTFGVRGYQVNLRYDPAILSSPLIAVGPATPAGWVFSSNIPAPGDARVLTINLAGTAVPIAGVLFTISFSVGVLPPAGTLVLVSLADVSGPSGEIYPTIVRDGGVFPP